MARWRSGLSWRECPGCFGAAPRAKGGRLRCPLVRFGQQGSYRHFQHLRYGLQGRNRHVLRTTLDPPDIGAVNPSRERETLL